MQTDPIGGRSEIPVLPGHYRRTMGYFLACVSGMVAGIGLFGVGLHWESTVVQVMGGVVALGGFLWMFGTLDRAQSAQCPNCSAEMRQGWDEQLRRSDGLFTCPQCGSHWRTPATWGFD